MTATLPAARAARCRRCQVGISNDHIGGTRNSRLEFIARRGERGADEIKAVRPRVALNTARRVAASPRLARRLSRPLPRGTWIDAATGQRLRGGGNVRAAAPLHQIPVYVRAGSIVVTYPEDEISDGLGDQRDDERPLEATLWGRPPGGRTAVRLADGTRIRWREGEWSVSRRREVRYAER